MSHTSGADDDSVSLSAYVAHLRTVQFTMLLSCVVILVAVYLSLQERRVSTAASQLGAFASALTDEGEKSWEIGIRDYAWNKIETPALRSKVIPEIPEHIDFYARFPTLQLTRTSESERVLQEVEDRRAISSRDSYLEFLFDLLLLRFPNHSVVLSNPKFREGSECLGPLKHPRKPDRVSQLRLFWQDLRNLQVATFTKRRLEGEYHILVSLVEDGNEQRPATIFSGAVTIAEAVRASADEHLSTAMNVASVSMQPCILEGGTVPIHSGLVPHLGRVGSHSSGLFYSGEFDLTPVLSGGDRITLRILLVPVRHPVHSIDGREAMNLMLGGRKGDGTFDSSFPELASIGRREVLISTEADARAALDPEWSQRRDAANAGLERLEFDIRSTKVPLPPRPEDRIDLFGAKVQVEDVVLWGGLVLLGVQFYFLMHLFGFIELLEVHSTRNLTTPWIGLYRGHSARIATLATTSLAPVLICGYLTFRFVERDLGSLLILGGGLVTGISLVIAVFTALGFRRVWSMT